MNHLSNGIDILLFDMISTNFLYCSFFFDSIKFHLNIYSLIGVKLNKKLNKFSDVNFHFFLLLNPAASTTKYHLFIYFFVCKKSRERQLSFLIFLPMFRINLHLILKLPFNMIMSVIRTRKIYICTISLVLDRMFFSHQNRKFTKW